MRSVFRIDGQRILFGQSPDGVVDESRPRQLRRVEEVAAQRESLIGQLLIVGVIKTWKNLNRLNFHHFFDDFFKNSQERSFDLRVANAVSRRRKFVPDGWIAGQSLVVLAKRPHSGRIQTVIVHNIFTYKELVMFVCLI